MGALLDIVTKDATNRSLTLRMADSTDGTPETGVTSATAGLDVWYRREGGLKVSLTESDLSALTDAHSDGGLLHVSDGEYRVDFPDAAFATAANYVDVGWGATGMVGFGGRVRLTDLDLEDVTAAGLTDLSELQSVISAGIAAETRNNTLIEQLKVNRAVTEHQRGAHTHQPIGNIFFVDPVNGDTHANGNRGGITDPYLGVQDCHNNAVTDSNHDMIILLSGAAAGATTLTEDVTLSKRYLFIRGPGRDFIWTRSGNGDTITITADGVELFGFQVNTAATGVGNGITVTSADFFRAEKLWVNNTQGHGIQLTDCDNAQIIYNHLHDSGQSGAGHGLVLDAATGQSGNNILIEENHFHGVAGDAIRLNPTGTGTVNDAVIATNHINNSTGDGIDLTGAGVNRANIYSNVISASGGVNINDSGTGTVDENNQQWAKHSIATEARLAELDAANLPADVDAILADTGTTIPAQITALNNISAAEVNAEVLDVLNVDTFAEPAQGAPAATTTLVDKIGFLYKAWRNKKDLTSSLYQLYDDAGTTVDQKAPVSDDNTTFESGEVITGP